ncbi:uncharacterized protein LOC124639114 [Helicoverpa zea]|uniref:uncharacterized protein LOC124639114 n=1 Tax=Helicoverpa zea TaxID=7113 RepID=UPI001F5A9853|nr:uncharacterized protein LOC124639114 [Helicoverpa zea]
MFNPKRTPPKAVLRSEQSTSEPDLAKISKTPSEYEVTGANRKRKQPECEHAEQIATMDANLTKTLSEWKASLDANLLVINDNIKSIRGDLETYMNEIKKEMDCLRSENISIKATVSKLTEEVSEIKSSCQFISNQYDDCQKKFQSLEESTPLRCEIKTLEAKIDYLEQQARECNLEISNVPERREENLFSILEEIGKKIDLAIPREEITAIHRVPHAASSERPKNIIAKFKTRYLRDNILSAYRLKKGVISTDLGILGAPRTVYVNEHLTLHKKQLLRETREVAKKYNYKFVWVKHSTILAKRCETSPTIAIKTKNDLCKITTSNIS